MNRKKKQPKPVEGYRRNKLAFDKVMEKLRELMGMLVGAMGAVNLERSGGSAAPPPPGKPTPVEFRCDVFKAIGAKIPKDIDLVKFHLAYTLYDSEDYIEREVHAQKILGDRRHSVEQRLGEEFIRRGLYPVQGKGYFHYVRDNPRGTTV